MHRKYMSGAHKRKLQAEKKAKESAAIAKNPKINEIFSAVVVPSTSSANAETENVARDRDENAHSDFGNDVPMQLEAELETRRNSCDASTSTSTVKEDLTLESIQIATDPALWNIPADMSSLQSYWLHNGKYACKRYSNRKKYFIFDMNISRPLVMSKYR